MDIMTIVLFIIGLVLLIGGAESLVRGASSLAVSVGISPLVVGLTVVAFGTSSPELAVTVQSSFQGQADIALGNVVGSNIANILLIIGVGAVITPLIVSQQLVRLEVPLMIGISFLLYGLWLDGLISRWDGLLLSTLAIAYTFFTVQQSRKETKAIQAEYAQEFSAPQPGGAKHLIIQLSLIAVGLVLLVIGSNWLVNGAVALAELFGLSELVIGLTIIAIGTSLPEVATVVVASLRGERDIAVGNAIGSNIFNILLVLGLCAVVAPAGVNVTATALQFDMPVMIAVAIACLPIFFTNYQITRWEGGIFLIYYAVYLTYLVLDANGNQAADTVRNVMFFIIPLTVLTIIILLVRALRRSNPNPHTEAETPQNEAAE
jgi:cation:H+ antiporter